MKPDALKLLPTHRTAWREPMVWLVVAGPALVVIASLVTAVLAWRGADALVIEAATVRDPSQLPALKARNHAATPGEPGSARP